MIYIKGPLEEREKYQKEFLNEISKLIEDEIVSIVDTNPMFTILNIADCDYATCFYEKCVDGGFRVFLNSMEQINYFTYDDKHFARFCFKISDDVINKTA